MTRATLTEESEPRETRVVRTVTRSSRRWQELVTTRPSDLFHSPAWHRVIHDTYGFEPVGRILLGAGGRALAGLVTCELDDFRGRRQVGLPFSDYCDPLVDSLEQWQLLTADIPTDRPLRIRCLHNDLPRFDPEFHSVGAARWHMVRLGRPLEQLWSGLDGGARRAIRKAQQARVSVRASVDERDLRSFFEMHLAVRKRKYGYLAQPYRFFEAIKRHLLDTGAGTLLLAEMAGEPIAAVMLLTWRRRAYYKFAASRAERLDNRPNDLLMWHCIRYARRAGFDALDLGLSDEDQPGLLRYKRKFASEEKVISFLERPGAPGSCIQGRTDAWRLLADFAALMTGDEVPDSVTERAGDLVYRYFA